MENRSVLVVDDDPEMLEFCRTALSREGYGVTVAENGAQALPKLQASSFDLVLTDHVLLPPQWGSMTSAVKTLKPSTAVIVMTGSPSVERAMAALREGASHYLVKPFTVSELRQAVAACFKERPRPEPGQFQFEWLKHFLPDIFYRGSGSGRKLRVYVEADLPGASGLEEGLTRALAGLARQYSGRLEADDTLQASPAASAAPSAFGRYEIVRELGRGAMGRVYLCRDPRIDRLVAVKTARFDEASEEGRELKRRFFQEAQAAGRLSHPGIVRIFDVGEEGGEAFIAMEYLEGFNLGEFVREPHLLPAAQVARLGASVAAALDYAHRQGVVHRDVKPANLMLLKDRQTVCVTDFGLARLMSASDTLRGTVMGTPHYMSPEQVEGSRVDGRADVFSLGAVLFELFAGRKPWKPAASIEQVLRQIVHEVPPALTSLRPELGEPLSRLIEKALRKDPAERFETAGAFAAALLSCPGPAS